MLDRSSLLRTLWTNILCLWYDLINWNLWNAWMFSPHYHKLCRRSVTPHIIMCVSGLGGEIRSDETLSSPTGDWVQIHTTNQQTGRKKYIRKQRNKAEYSFKVVVTISFSILLFILFQLLYHRQGSINCYHILSWRQAVNTTAMCVITNKPHLLSNVA